MADGSEAFAESIEPRCLSLSKTDQLLAVAGLGFAKLTVDHGELFPLFGERSRAWIDVAAAASRRLPLADPEGAVLGPALRLGRVVVRDQVVEVVEVTLEPLLDVAELLGTALEVGGRGADRGAERLGVAPAEIVTPTETSR